MKYFSPLVICTYSAQGIKSKHPIHSKIFLNIQVLPLDPYTCHYWVLTLPPRSSYGLWLTFVWPSSAGRRMTPLEHCPAGTWLPLPRTCVPFSSARPPSNEWWPGLFLWQHQAKTKGHIHHCFHLSSGDNFHNFYFTNQKLFQGVISEEKNLFN